MIAEQRFHFRVAGFVVAAVQCPLERLCQVVRPDLLAPVGLQPLLVPVVPVVLPGLLVRLRLPCPEALMARVVRELLLVVVAVVVAAVAAAVR